MYWPTFRLERSPRSSEVAGVERYISTSTRCTLKTQSHPSLVALIDDFPQRSLLLHAGTKPRSHWNHALQRIPQPYNHQRLRYTIRRVAPLPHRPRNTSLQLPSSTASHQRRHLVEEIILKRDPRNAPTSASGTDSRRPDAPEKSVGESASGSTCSGIPASCSLTRAEPSSPSTNLDRVHSSCSTGSPSY